MKRSRCSEPSTSAANLAASHRSTRSAVKNAQKNWKFCPAHQSLSGCYWARANVRCGSCVTKRSRFERLRATL